MASNYSQLKAYWTSGTPAVLVTWITVVQNVLAVFTAAALTNATTREDMSLVFAYQSEGYPEASQCLASVSHWPKLAISQSWVLWVNALGSASGSGMNHRYLE